MNPGLSYKAGVFIGDALQANSKHPIEKLVFKLIRLGDDGLLRIIEAMNNNPNISVAHLGIISD